MQKHQIESEILNFLLGGPPSCWTEIVDYTGPIAVQIGTLYLDQRHRYEEAERLLDRLLEHYHHARAGYHRLLTQKFYRALLRQDVVESQLLFEELLKVGSGFPDEQPGMFLIDLRMMRYTAMDLRMQPTDRWLEAMISIDDQFQLGLDLPREARHIEPVHLFQILEALNDVYGIPDDL